MEDKNKEIFTADSFDGTQSEGKFMCVECGTEVETHQRLMYHIKTKHDHTELTYLQKYPNAPTYSPSEMAAIKGVKVSEDQKKIKKEVTVDHIKEKIKTSVISKDGDVLDKNTMTSDYFLSILEGEDKDFFKQTKLDFVTKHGFEDTPLLDELSWLVVENRRKHIEYENKRRMESFSDESLLKEIKGNTTKIAALQKELEFIKSKRAAKNVNVDLHDQEMKRGEKYIRAHRDEFVVKCPNCDHVVSTDGLPAWMFEFITKEAAGGDKKPFFLWSREAYYLFKKGLLSIVAWAFILRTSIEGVLYEAKQKEIKVEYDFEKEIDADESQLKKVMTDFEEEEMEEFENAEEEHGA